LHDPLMAGRLTQTTWNEDETMKRVLLSAGALCAAFLGFALLVDGLGSLTWSLSGAGKLALADLEAIPTPERHPSRPKALHSVAEWPAGRGRNFHEAPMLRALVRAGGLPQVAERLPENPLVVVPPEQNGPYGGTWVRLGKSAPDVGIFEARLAYEGLVRWGPMGRKILPNLAVRWAIEDGGRTYTFWLRPGVRWSDGEPFTADDIVFWYEDVVKNEKLTPIVSRDLRRGGEIVQLDKLDDYTVRFRFKEPHGLFLQQMASWLGYAILRHPAHYLKRFHASYVPQEELDRLAKEKRFDFWYQLFSDRCDWSNPQCPRLWAWVLKTPTTAQPIVFERNPYYWKVDPEGNQLPYIDRMTFDILGNETINLKAINGELGMQGRHLAFTNYPLFMEGRKKGGYRVFHWINSGGGENILALNLNHKDPVLRQMFADRRFRIALSHALKRDELNEVSFFGIGRPRQVCPPPASPYYSGEYERAYTDYDPAKANRLLDEMGLTERDGEGIRLRPDGQPLTLQIEVPDVFVNTQLFELVADHWTAVGVKTRMKLQARQIFYARKAALLFDVGTWGSADEVYPVMDPRWFLPYSGESIHAIGYARWVTSYGEAGIEPTGDIRRCIELYQQIQLTPDPDEHIRLFGEIIELNRRNLWVIGTVGEVPSIFVVNNTFRNVPEVAIAGWVFRTPGNTAPECYAIEEAPSTKSRISEKAK